MLDSPPGAIDSPPGAKDSPPGAIDSPPGVIDSPPGVSPPGEIFYFDKSYFTFKQTCYLLLRFVSFLLNVSLL